MTTTEWAGAAAIVDGPGGYSGIERRRSGPTKFVDSPVSRTRPCWRTTTSCRPSRTSPITSATPWHSRGSPRRRKRAPSCSAVCISWRRRQDPQPRQDGADPRRACGVLARRFDHRGSAAGVEGRSSRRRRRLVRQHHGRGQRTDRHLLHIVERRRRRRIHRPRPRGAVPAGPVPRRTRQTRDRQREHPHLAGECHVHAGINGDELAAQARSHPDATCSSIPNAGVRPPRSTSRARVSCPTTRSRSSRPAA